MANILIAFGFCWMAVAALIGLFLAKRHKKILEQLGKSAANIKLSKYHRVNDIYKWNKAVHIHAFIFSFVSICIGLRMPKLNNTEMVNNALAVAIIVSAVIWAFGVLQMVVRDLALSVREVLDIFDMTKVV